MANDITIGIAVETTEAEMSIEEVKAKADELTRDWKIRRNTLMREIREGFTLISSLWSSFRQAMTLFGQQIDPFYGALIGMVLSTVSMLLSAASTLSATVIGIPLGAILFGLAMSFNILSIGKLLAENENIRASFAQLAAAGAAAGAADLRTSQGVSF